MACGKLETSYSPVSLFKYEYPSTWIPCHCLSCVCAADAWKSLTDKVQEARSNARLKQLSFAGNSLH